MTSVALILLFAGSLWVQDRPGQDPSNLERFKKKSPLERTRLRERLRRFKELASEEQQGLREALDRLRSKNPEDLARLRRRFQNLNQQERARLQHLRRRFAQFAAQEGMMPGFPRQAFFEWLKKVKPDELRRSRRMTLEERRREFQRLYGEFDAFLLDRLDGHVAKHRCCTSEEIQSVRRLRREERQARMPSFWKGFHQKHRSSKPSIRRR